MSKLRTAISFDKKNLPPYIFKFNIALVSCFAAWFILCIPVAVTVGCIYEESFITYAVMVAVFILFFIGLIIFLAVWLKLQKRLIARRAAELSSELRYMPQEQAFAFLKERNVITDAGFICNDVFGSRVVPFEEARLSFEVGVANTKIVLILCVISADNGIMDYFEIDGAMYNFLIKNDFELGDSLLFKMLVNDKAMFAESVLKNKLKRHL